MVEEEKGKTLRNDDVGDDVGKDNALTAEDVEKDNAEVLKVNALIDEELGERAP